MRIAGFCYGVVAYLLFLAGFAYLVGFVGNVFVPKSIDFGSSGDAHYPGAINGLLLALFAVQHSVMARPWFKVRWTRMVPASLERSTYVLLTTVVLGLLFWRWEPMARVVWSVQNGIGRNLLWSLFWLGWAIVVGSTFMISHFDLFGLRQVWHRLRATEPAPLAFKERWLYRIVRHPLMLGFLIAFWATPDMTAGHLLFSFGMTAYIFLGVHFEERDLLAEHGESYARYQREVRGVVPMPKSRPPRQDRSRNPGMF